MTDSPPVAASTTNLLDLPFILVTTSDSSRDEVGLLELFRRAPELLCLDGETAPVDAAVLRLLVAIVLLALAERDQDPVQTWAEAWRDWENISIKVCEHLEAHRDEFDLSHPTSPFMQQAQLEPVGSLPEGFDRIIAYDGQWFSVRDSARPMCLREAARWLLYTQAFGLAGIQTGQRGDPTVKGGRGYPTGYPAWCGNLGLVVWHGKSLAQTILLNSPLGDFPNETSAGWQRQTPVHSRKTEQPKGAAELLVWTNRRIRLHIAPDGLVHAVQVSYGDTLTPQNMNSLEPMSAWRHSDNQSKKSSREVMMPVTHQPERQVWRGLGSLLAVPGGQPMTARWLTILWEKGVLDPRMAVRMQTIGVVYGPQNSSVQSIIDDSLVAQLGVLTNHDLVLVADQAVKVASDGVGAMVHLADELAAACGNAEPERARARAALRAYGEIDPEYRAWLAGVSADIEEADVITAWHMCLRDVLLRVGREMVLAAGAAGLRGRIVDERFVNSAEALAWFEGRVRRLTPHANPAAPASAVVTSTSSPEGNPT